METVREYAKVDDHRSGGSRARSSPSPTAAPHPLLLLQQQAGNQAVQELLCSGLIRAKLAVSQPGDPEEGEADQMANHAMRAHTGYPISAPSSCAEDDESGAARSQTTPQIQRRADGLVARIAETAVSASPASPSSKLGSGQPLDAASRAFFEPRFRYDLSSVRIHTGAEAMHAAQNVEALAYTSGRNLVFAPNQYSPQTSAGRHLLAHELTHVIQQSEAPRLGRVRTMRLPARGSQTIQRKDAPKPKTTLETDAEYVTAKTKAGNYAGLEEPVPEGQFGPPQSGGAFWLLNGLSDRDMLAVLKLCDRAVRKDLLKHIAEAEGRFGRARLESIITESIPDTYDRIASKLLGAVDYDDYLATLKSTGTKTTRYFGKQILHQDSADMLKTAEDDLAASQPPGYKPPSISSTIRARKAMHAFGMAIDFDVEKNPYVLNESGERELDKELSAAYDHIAQFMLGKAHSDLNKLKGGRKAFGPDGKTPASISDIYDALHEESVAMQQYFEMKDDQSKLADFLGKQWPAKHAGETPPDAASVQTQMVNDYEVLGGKTASGTKRPTAPGTDRPFAPSSGGGRGDPSTGFLNLDKAFVVAMTNAGFAWGAIDIQGEPGDIQHFDLRLSGLGKQVYTMLL